MPYSNAPTNDTYSSRRIPMAWPLKLRPGNQNYLATATPLQAQDEGMVNALPIQATKEGDNLTAITRPAINGTYINNTGENGVVRGMHVWEKTAGTVYYFVVVGTKVYTTSGTGTIPAAGGWTNVTTLTTVATTPVRFTEFIDNTNTKKLVLVDGVEGYVFTSNAAGTKITDVDFPSPHIPFPVFLNSRLFLAKAGTGDIYNSDLNDPSLWTAGSFISTEVYPDDVQALVKVNNYILAIGTEGSEFFYDAANAVGTPLARYEGGLLPFGTQFPNSIASTKDTVVLLANTSDGQTVFKAIEGMKHADIDSTSIVPMYNRMLTNPNVGFEIPAANCRGYFFRNGGLLYYSFLFDGVRASTYRTAVYDACYTYSFQAKAWTEAQYGSDFTNRGNRYALPVQFSAPSTSGADTTYIAGNVGSTDLAFFGQFNDLVGYDVISSLSNSQFYLEFRTPNLDFGTFNRKFMSRATLFYEAGDSSLNSVWRIQWNDYDYDYNQWSTAVQLSPTTPDYFPTITQLGQFRRRAFRFYTVSGKTMTAKEVEFDINKGVQ